MQLGEQRFAFAVEAMAGEEVVWEGGPSPKATWLQALRWLLATLLVVDLDKILSVQASSGWLDRRFGIHHVEIVVGGILPQKVPTWAKSEHNTLAYVPASENLLSKLTNDWLPRDNRR